MTSLPVSSIRLDHALQSRAVIDPATVSEYAEAMAGGASFPPLDVYVIDAHHVVADGFHRFLAHQQNGDATIPVVVHPGGREAAVRHALGANARHGLKRTNADKRRAVEIALKEFSDMSDRAIAEMCGVNHHLVADARPKPQLGDSPSSPPAPPPARKGLDGKVRRVPPAPKPASDLASSPIVKRAMATLAEASGEAVEAVPAYLDLDQERIAEIKSEVAALGLDGLNEALLKGMSEYTPVPRDAPGYCSKKNMRYELLKRMHGFARFLYPDGQAQASMKTAVDQMERIPRGDRHRRKYLRKLRDYCETALAERKQKEDAS